MKTPDQTNGVFKTSDLYFAAYLQTAGVPLARLDKEDKRRIFFVFDTSGCDFEELKSSWAMNSAKINAQGYANNIKSLKSVCHME